MRTPVALTLFSRPEDVQRVFECIREARPPMLFLISDGGRTPEEQQLIERSRHIAEAVDWPCTVFKNYSEKNMGPRRRLSSGITWVFENVEEAIILEHDCLPHPDFFPFCETLLGRYRDDERVMHISGNNFQQHNSHFACSESYYFSIVPNVWGFATWRRAWNLYDPDLRLWPQVKEQKLLKNVPMDPAVRDRWEYRFEQYYKNEIDSWDGQWVFACFINGGLSINPRVNLVSNIGYGPQAFTTKDPHSHLANIPTTSLPQPLIHPIAMLPDRMADAYIFWYLFEINKRLGQRVRWFFKSMFPRSYTTARRLLKGSSAH